MNESELIASLNAERDKDLPKCGKCGKAMRPETAKIHPEYFLHDACLPDELKPPVRAFGCVNNTIRVRSGAYLDLLNPQPDQFTFADITGALSKICRFGGQVNSFYSVAEHSWHCAMQGGQDGLPLDTQAALLMHDAAEAFIGDMVKPLKIAMPGYQEVERRMEGAIAEKFLIDFDRESYAVQKIDREMLIAERRALFSRDEVEWTGEREVRALERCFPCWTPNLAERAFTRLAKSIGIET